jgi:hypothetical protein
VVSERVNGQPKLQPGQQIEAAIEADIVVMQCLAITAARRLSRADEVHRQIRVNEDHVSRPVA